MSHETTLDHELSYGDIAFPRYSITTQITQWAGVDSRWVARQVRRGVASPALFRGERQFDRANTIQLLLLAKLQTNVRRAFEHPVQDRRGRAPCDR